MIEYFNIREASTISNELILRSIYPVKPIEFYLKFLNKTLKVVLSTYKRKGLQVRRVAGSNLKEIIAIIANRPILLEDIEYFYFYYIIKFISEYDIFLDYIFSR